MHFPRSIQQPGRSERGPSSPNLASDLGHGDGGARDAGSEDKEAGELGKPFTEAEDDEEWVGWVDWGALGGGSGSA